MKNPNIELAIKLYYEEPEISNEEIRQLFDVKNSKACKMKKEVKEEMAKKGVKCFRTNTINTKVAFEVWRLDIDDLEHRLTRLRRLKLV